jgi:hypothetical protein
LSQQNSNLRQTITRQMQELSTPELLDIWRENNREEWTELALEVVAEILHQRLGYTFEHNEPLQSPDEENMPAEVNGEVEIYHSPERLIRIASLAEAFSWVVLVFFLLRFAVSFYEQFQLQFLSKSLWLVRPPSQPWLELLRDGSSLMAGIFFALVLQAVAQIIYLGMDIYEEIQLIPRQEDLDSTEQETRE